MKTIFLTVIEGCAGFTAVMLGTFCMGFLMKGAPEKWLAAGWLCGWLVGALLIAHATIKILNLPH
jgi:hypothetical protein